MRKLILRSLWYVIPFSLIYIFSVRYYNLNSGDLLRLGYIPDYYSNYYLQFSKYTSLPEKFQNLSDLPQQKKFKVLTIGDSFTGQRNFGYKNQLAQEVSVLNVTDISWNPIETLSMLTNGDFFDNYEVEYVVLESVERSMSDRVKSFDIDKAISYDEVITKMKKLQQDEQEELDPDLLEKKAHEHLLFSNQALKFLWNSLRFELLKDAKFENDVWKATLMRRLFSVENDKFIFFNDDLLAVMKNNDKSLSNELNNRLNQISTKLKEKNIQLIFMTAPDKYGVYYDEIDQTEKSYPYPFFFDNFSILPKDYLYLDAQKILKQRVNEGSKDVYLFGDTHWSPKSAELIKDEIIKLINKKYAYPHLYPIISNGK